jgi:hypothetical protein
MAKELRPQHEDISCDICGRTILKGERIEPYLAPGGQRHVVCELCTDRAYNEGWIREAAHDEMPAAMRRPDQRRGILGRLRRRRDAEPLPAADGAPPDEPFAGEDGYNGSDPVYEDPAADAAPAPELAAEPEPAPPPPPLQQPEQRPRQQRRDARHVRAVPTNAQVKVERALELFNRSVHVRTIGGLARTLGEPWVSAAPLADAPAEVSIVVAWELSWYRFRVDLGDADDPVTLVNKGQELDELDESMRDWNATAQADGRLAVGVAS